MSSSGLRTVLSERLGLEVPIICGPMYPCSNLELVAAVSAAGGLGVVQPISTVIVYRQNLRWALQELRRRAPGRPIGFNAIVEKTTPAFERQMRGWVDVALEERVSLFVTALGDPGWVVRLAHQAGIPVYHDVTSHRWALRALDAGVDGLICVNDRAGGHAGRHSAEALFEELAGLGVPLICAGGIGSAEEFVAALRLGYAGVQMGTRFIATEESAAHADYKQAILRARAEDIVLTDKISGVPVAVIRTPFVEKMGTRAGPLARWLLRGPRTKRWMRTFYGLTSLWKLRQATLRGAGYHDYFQAGKSVDTIDRVEPAGEIVRRFAAVAVESAAAAAQ
jgi:nitronate monooxygenase